VDDINTNLVVADGLLNPYGVKTDCCLSGSEALGLFKRRRYDLVLMDHMMPGMDGIEAAAEIRRVEKELYGADEGFAPVPVIALTASALTGMKEMFLEKGFNDYLSKPIDISKLDDVLDKWIPEEKKIKASGREYAKSADSPRLHIEGVDILRGMLQTGGGEADYRLVLASFYEDALERVEYFSLPPEGGEAPALLAVHAHALKGAAATIGAAELSQKAASLERAGKAGDTEAIRREAAPFYRDLKSLAENIRTALEGAESPAGNFNHEKH
jgi:CheY-like chemotaxis protein